MEAGHWRGMPIPTAEPAPAAPATTGIELAALVEALAKRTQGIGGYDRYHALRDAAKLLRGEHVGSAPGISEPAEIMRLTGAAAVAADAGQATDARDAAKYRALHTPEVVDFIKAVENEALFQRDKWAAQGDAGKSDADWFWLVGYLAGKAIRPDATKEKQLHHIITTAAACLNWHGARVGAYTLMRPGHAEGIAAGQPGKGAT